MALKMDQREFNSTAHQWLDNLAQSPDDKVPVQLPGVIDDSGLDLPFVLEKLGSSLKLAGHPKTSLQAGGTHLSVLGRGLASYLHVALDHRDIDTIANNVHTSTTQCLLHLLGLSDTSIYSSCAALYHDDVRDGIVRVLQMALYRKYDKYAFEGVCAVTSKPPVVYISAKGEVPLLYQTCVRIGLPLSCVSVVPCSTLHTSSHTMDIDSLERQISDDLNQGKTPLFIMAYAGTPLAGHIDDISSLRRVADSHNMWLHASGHALSSLCFSEEQPELTDIKHTDSITLFPATWFGLHSCPMVTLHRHPKIIQTEGLPTAANFPSQQQQSSSEDEETAASSDKPTEEAKLDGNDDTTSSKEVESSGIKPGSSSEKDGSFPIPSFTWNALYPHGLGRLLPLSLWMCTHYLGRSALLGTVDYGRNLINHMMIRLDEIPGIRRIVIPNHAPNVVLFKYWGGGSLVVPPSLRKLFNITIRPPPHKEEDKTSDDQTTPPATPPQPRRDPQEEEELVITVHNIPLPTANMYNLMISREMQPYIPKVGVVTFDLGGRDGVCFRFDPVRSFPEMSTSLEDVQLFSEKLAAQAERIHALALARCLFEVGLRKNANIRWMEFPSLHCVAVVQYVPTEWLEKKELTLTEVDSLNKLNLELARLLTKISAVFAPFQHGNFSCVLVKDLSPDMSMYELLERMIVETKQFEQNKKLLEGMSDKIREGIEAAKQDLTKEKERLEQEEGILRNLPLVGSVLNWWSPPSPSTAQGRTFSLSSGKVAPTADVYKHKMMVVPEQPAEEGEEAMATPRKNDTSPAQPVEKEQEDQQATEQ